MFIAAMLLETTEAWISVYSTGQRASSMVHASFFFNDNIIYDSDTCIIIKQLLETVAKFVRSAGENRVTKHNKEELFVRGNPGELERRLYSYPSNVKVGLQQKIFL